MLKNKDKIHLGLITTDRQKEAAFKEALAQAGGGYVHVARDHLEMNQKLGLQTIDILIYDCPKEETGAGAQALVHFFRNKRDYQKMPICLLYPENDFAMKFLITDPRVRGFSASAGAFLPLTTLMPFMHSDESPFELEPLRTEWIESEFLASLKDKLGGQTDFHPHEATDDDLHSSYLCQVNEEVRSHLAWVKSAARILERKENSFSKLFVGMDREAVEEIAQTLLNQIVAEFQEKLKSELINRGALFFPAMENMSAPDRKQIYAGSKTAAFIFASDEIAVLLEMIRYF